jgi:hypothetical protein
MRRRVIRTHGQKPVAMSVQMLVIICCVGQKLRTVSPGIERPVDGVVCDITSHHHWARFVCYFRVESYTHELIRPAI